MRRDSDDDEVNDDNDSGEASSDDSDDDTTADNSNSDNSGGNDMDNDTSADDATDSTTPDQSAAVDAVRSATPEEDDAHRGMLGEVLGVLQGQGIDVNQLAQQYGLPHADVDNMSPEQLVQMAQKLAQDHPEIVAQVSQNFPMAQGLLGMITGGGGQGGAGGGLGGLLGRFL